MQQSMSNIGRVRSIVRQRPQQCYMRHEITETAWLSVKAMAAYLLQSFAESFKFSKYVHF